MAGIQPRPRRPLLVTGQAAEPQSGPEEVLTSLHQPLRSGSTRSPSPRGAERRARLDLRHLPRRENMPVGAAECSDQQQSAQLASLIATTSSFSMPSA
eukprot:10758796-Heterocapsa_arctica.AAC.1